MDLYSESLADETVYYMPGETIGVKVSRIIGRATRLTIMRRGNDWSEIESFSLNDCETLARTLLRIGGSGTV